MFQPAIKVIKEPDDVVAALKHIGLSREAVVAVARAAAAARAEALPIDPVSAPGWFAYAHGVRHMRLRLLPSRGWRSSRTGNVESTVHDELGIQLCFQNVDSACKLNHEPHAISRKGAAARRQVAEGQGELFDAPKSGGRNRLGCPPTVWVICVEATESSLRVEVSRPKSFQGEQFEGFHERIFVLDEEIEDLNVPAEDDTTDLDDFDVPVSKKL